MNFLVQAFDITLNFRDINMKLFSAVIIIFVFSQFNNATVGENYYRNNSSRRTISSIPLPNGYTRTKSPRGTFASWLRNLPLKRHGSPVLLFNGRLKGNQNAHYAVINMSVGKRDLQQCADAIMRLRAEYLFRKGAYKKIKFNFTSGDPFPFKKWARGYRPVISGNSVRWKKKAGKDYSYKNFKKYLTFLFIYAGTASLSKEMKKTSMRNMRIGDIFIQGGFPGHAVIIIDMAYNPETGSKLFMLAQSYMPAQEIHVLRNPSSRNPGPWYSTKFRGKLHTPEWTFRKRNLKRFR